MSENGEKILILKKEGDLLSELISRARIEYKISEKIPVTYAGRLDPMASGLMLLLIGNAVHDKDAYLKLQKTYEVEMLFGVSSDTQDALGKISSGFRVPTFSEVKQSIENFPHEYEQEYPMYSSKPVDGIPLFTHAREGRVVEIPKHTVMIHEIMITNSKEMTGVELSHEAIKRVQKVNGDFRQKEIIDGWKNFEADFGEKKFLIVNATVTVEGGTYIRILTRDIARILGTEAVAWKIVRTKIGDFS